jgi:hypothetical protein
MTLSSLQQLGRLVAPDMVALRSAARDLRAPWYARLAAGVASYVDALPLLGHLTEVLFVPLAVRLIPPRVWEEHYATAAQWAMLLMSSC